MAVIFTNHFFDRAAIRFDYTEARIKKEVEHMFKLVKKNKLMPEHSEKCDKCFVLRYQNIKVIYSKNQGDYIVITVGQRDFSTKFL